VCGVEQAGQVEGAMRDCSKGPPRHVRLVVLVPDGVTAVRLEKRGGFGGDQNGGCAGYTFAEARTPVAPERPF
jgi:hypothetical protein